MTNPVTILGLAGSLRTASHNQALLRAAARLAPAHVDLVVFERLKAIPVFDEDLEPEPPEGVLALCAAVDRADAILLATPEYNQSMPGAMKNLLDWLSRPTSHLAGKPVGLMGASTGQWGTRIAQSQLRHVLIALGALVMPTPPLFVPNVATAFDAGGELLDPDLTRRLGELTASLATWAARTTPLARP
jgi:chromate reductase